VTLMMWKTHRPTDRMWGFQSLFPLGGAHSWISLFLFSSASSRRAK
jgi:hypothetical protein